MTHLHFQTDVTSVIKDNTLILDFRLLPVDKLVAMRRLSEGMSATWCDSWSVAARAATKALMKYLGNAMQPTIIRDGHELQVKINGDINDVTTPIINLFRSEGITIEHPGSVRPR